MRVLIIRLSSIGDVILTTPVLKALKEKYPEIKIDFLVMDKFKAAIEDCPYVDKVIVFEKNKHDGLKNILEFSKKLKKNNYECIFDLHSKMRSFMISKIIGSKIYRYKKRALWKTVLVKMKLIKYEVDDTIVKNYFGAFTDFNLKYEGEKLNFSFKAEDLKGIESKYLGLPVFAPGASKNTKKWLPENFGELAKLIYKKYGKKVIVIGGNEDNEAAQVMSRISNESIINLCGKLTLKESGALLSKAKYLITNDSGPFHIARGVGCPTFVIFGPTSPRMFELDKKDKLVFAEEKCSPCSLHGDKQCPKGHFNCMKNIKAKKIFEMIEKSNLNLWEE